MHQETIAGLHKCKAKNTPQQGEVKNMVVEHKPPRNGKKAWIKITNKKPEEGGSPYRILNVEKLDWPPDEHQNIAFNIEVEPSSNAPTAFQQARSAMQDGDPSEYGDGSPDPVGNMFKKSVANASESSVQRSNGGDGVADAKKHLCAAANLYVLCVRCVNSMIADELPEIARTSEMFQAAVGTLFIEASRAGLVSKMPETPIKAAPQVICICENTDGDNPLCPVHSE